MEAPTSGALPKGHTPTIVGVGIGLNAWYTILS